MSVPFFTTDALVLREVRYKEADRILTILTPERGKLTVKARGALRNKSKTAAATQLLTWSEMTVFENRERMTVNEASVKEDFIGLRADFTAYALGCYFAEVTEAVTREEIPEPGALKLILNSLFALSNHLAGEKQVKAAFELRLASMLGYTPDLSVCRVCGNPRPEHPMIGIQDGHLYCRDCRDFGTAAAPIIPDTLECMRYILSAPPKRFLSFRCEGETLNCLSRVCEDFLMEHLSRGFGTLSYYRGL